jgi:O-glycosyl hydrolase
LPLQRGELVNLHVSAQQYAYARQTKTGVVVVAINNDAKPATIEFAVTPAGLADRTTLVDRLGSLADVRISGGKLKATLPARSAAVLVPR